VAVANQLAVQQGLGTASLCLRANDELVADDWWLTGHLVRSSH
jgi:hypothetical protein